MRFRFADYVLDTDRRELTRGSERVQMGPQVFDLLVHLVDNRERVVSKDDMLEAVWSVGSFPSRRSPVISTPSARPSATTVKTNA